MQNSKVLVIDDEQKIREILKTYLEKSGFTVHQASDGKEALYMFKKENYDLIILDLMMPEIDGFEVCKKIRQNSNVSIIMLTAKSDEIDKVLGLELGADDYIVKPFSPREVVARVKAILRRTKTEEKNKKNNKENDSFTAIKVGSLVINIDTREVHYKDSNIRLTPKEFDLLVHLAQNPNIAFSREQLLEKIWGYDYYGDLRTVDTHIRRLREKLKKYCSKNYITTVWGVGYKLDNKEG